MPATIVAAPPTSLKIGGRETTDTDLLTGTLRAEQLLDARGKLSCKLINPPVPPAMDHDVLLTLAGVPFFGGIVVDVANDGGSWSVTASDNRAILDGLMINGVSPAGPLKSALQWFVDVTLGGFGFTVDPAMATGPIVPAIAFPFQTFTDGLKQLAILSEWSSTVSPTRVIRMDPGTAIAAPWPIDADVAEAITVRQSREQHATTVWVRYGSGAPSVVTWSTRGDGVSTSWKPPYMIATPPTEVRLDGPGGPATVPVVPYPDPANWTWEPVGGEAILRAPAADPPRPITDTIAITFVAAWPSVVVAHDSTVPLPVMVVMDYPDTFDAATAQQLAAGELARRSGYPRRFDVRTAKVGLQPGHRVPIVLPALGLNTDALVTGVRLSHAATLQDPAGEPWWSLAIDLLEANASRANWLTFWREDQRGAGHGTGSSATGTIPPSGGGGGGGGGSYAVWPLGGDHDAGYPGVAWQPIANACMVVTPASFTGRAWTVYATVKRLMGAGTYQLALTNAAGVNIATSVAVTADFESVIFGAAITPGETYHLRGRCSDGGTVFGTSAYLEAVAT